MKTNLLSMASVRILLSVSMLLGMVFPPGATVFAGVQHALDENVADSLLDDLMVATDSESEPIASIHPQAAARPDLQEQTTNTPPATTTDAPPLTPTPSDTGTPIPSSSVTETDTPPDTPEATESPATTEEITSTPSETATDIPSPTSTPSETPLTLILETAEEAIMPGESFTITYTIEGLAGLESTENLELAITMPEGIRPHGRDAKEWDQKTLTLRVPVESETSEFEWKIAPNAEGPFAIAAQLLQDEVVLAAAQLSLGDRSLFELSASGGEIDGLDGRVRIKFPKQAVRQDLKVRVRNAGRFSDIPNSLSGRPVEIIAKRADTRAKVEKFPATFTLEMHYEDDEIHGDEASLFIFYYSKKDKGWVPLITTVDTEANMMTAEVDHLSVFDFNTQDWEAARLPTLDNFQVAGFTGAATYSMPIEVPAGPGGLQPNLVLSYNSQVVDGANNYTQASWVGMGWSLDTGYVQRNMNGTMDYQDDDTFSLTVNGMGGLLLPVGEGTDSRGDYIEYQTAEHSFMRIRHYQLIDEPPGYDYDISYWLVWDKTGTLYQFDPGPLYPDFDTCGVELIRVWQWPLAKVTNSFGQELNYEYETEDKTTEGSCGYRAYTDVAVYPSAIYYPHERYRIVFNRTSRMDYDIRWAGYESYRILFMRSLLNDISIEHDVDGYGNFEVIRKYIFTYASEPEDLIFPNVDWYMEGDTPTLIQVQDYGLGGTEALPPTTFEYGDHMHLTRAENGYGGVVEFEYDVWHNAENDEDATAYQTHHWDGVDSEREIPELERDTYYPGSVYEFKAFAWTETWDLIQLGLDGGDVQVRTEQMPGLEPSGWDEFTAALTLPTSASTAMPLFYCYICNTSGFHLTLLPTRYRVVEKRLYDGINASPDVFNYMYYGGAMNDEEHSDGVSTDYPYNEEFTQFRGHEWSSVIALDDLENKILETKTWYYQDDILKGKPYKTEVRDGEGNLYNWSYTTYLSDEYPTSDLPEDEDHHTYTDLKIYWTRVDFEKSRRYEGDSDYVETRAGYSYGTSLQGGTQYGNVVSVVEHRWNGSSYDLYRRTNTRYYPRDDDNQYIVALPGYQVVRDAADMLLSRQLYYYDGETNVTIPPANGVLTATKTQIDDTHFSDTVITYDSWGNQDSVTQYSEYSADVWAFPSAESAQSTTTTYDPVYHTYPISTTNAEGHAVTWDYNWALGLPISETGPNGGTTTAEYDAFGRLTGITRPGDSDTISIAYYDSASPYRVEITERLDADTTTTSRRFYDGLGRKIQTQADDVELESGTRDVVVDMRYDEYGRLVEQTVPYAITDWNGTFAQDFGQPATVTEYDVLSRPETVTATDNTTVSYVYDDLLISATDANTHTTTQHTDVWGRLVLVEPPDGPSATYVYDELDQLTSVTSGGATTTIEYDMAGRKTSMDDADMGAWSYQYDALGNLTQQTDARGCVTELEYDSLNRLTDKTYSGSGECASTDPVSYTYDEGNYGLGQRTHMEDGSGYTDWTYDQRGRLIEEDKNITGAGTFVTEWTYNTANQITSMTYPAGPNSQESGETVTYDYLDQGAFNSLTGDSSYGNPTYVAASSYDAASRLTSRTLGSGLLETSYDYYAWSETNMGSRLQQMTTERLADETILQNLEYGYDAVGNVEWIKDWVAGSPQLQSYTYDDLDRLTGADVTGGSGGLYNESYSYDPVTGNLASKAGVSYGYQGAQPHAVTHLDDESLFVYDEVGNMVERMVGDEATFLTYDAEGHLIAAESTPAEPTPEPTVVELEAEADAWIAEYAGGESLVPMGTIALFTGSCPTNWERFSDLDGRFPRGAETAGGTGGSETHTHTYAEIPAHTHEAGTLTTSVDGSHRHSLHWRKPATGGIAPYLYGATAAGNWYEGVVSNAGDHSHDIEGETASTGVSDAQTEASSNVPPYLEMVFCEKVVSDQAELPVGAILLYDDLFPQGWENFIALDGRFPIGAETYGASGGTEEHTHVYHDVPEHSHTAGELVTTVDGEHSHDIRLRGAAGGNNPYPNGGMNPGSWYGDNVSTNGAHTHTVNGETASTGIADPQTESASSLPPYLDVVFAEKSASDGIGIPSDGIAMFDGVCPLGWTRVSALDERFPRGASTYGATGGSETHNHAYSEVPAHTHDVGTLSTVSAGAHTHELHWQGGGGGSAPYLSGGWDPWSNWYSAPVSYDGEHSHDLTGQTAGSGGTDLETDSTSILPPYSDIIFCKNTAPAQSAGDGTGTELQIGNDSSVGTTSRSVLRWDLSSVPEDVTIVSAEIELHVLSDESDNERTIQAYRLIPSWDEGSVTWETPWTEGGAAGAEDRDLEEAGSGTVPADPSGSVTIDLDPVKVAQMLHGTWEDQGFVLEVDVETDDLVRYHSRESAQAELRPMLRIAYRDTNNQFVYDGDGARVLTIVDGVITAYPGDHYEYEVGSDIARQYYTAGGRVAMRVSGDPEPSNNGVFYTLGDHLGSTSITVDESGAVVAELRYKAWGETRYANGETPTTWRYTGQRQEEGLGLYYYGARWYDPILGRFIQADTLGTGDRYTYVLNNPLIFTDPSGNRACLDWDQNGNCTAIQSPTDNSIKYTKAVETDQVKELRIPLNITKWKVVNVEVDWMETNLYYDTHPIDGMARAIMTEQGRKIFTEYEDDAAGVAWAIRIRYEDPSYYGHNWRIAITSMVTGMRSCSARDPMYCWSFSDTFASQMEMIIAYNRALEIAEEVYYADPEDDITNGALFWSDAKCDGLCKDENGDGIIDNPIWWNRTHFKIVPRYDAESWCVTTADTCD